MFVTNWFPFLIIILRLVGLLFHGPTIPPLHLDCMSWVSANYIFVTDSMDVTFTITRILLVRDVHASVNIDTLWRLIEDDATPPVSIACRLAGEPVRICVYYNLFTSRF